MPLRLREDLDPDPERAEILREAASLQAAPGLRWRRATVGGSVTLMILDNLLEGRGECFCTPTFCSYTATHRTLNLKSFGDNPTTDDQSKLGLRLLIYWALLIVRVTVGFFCFFYISVKNMTKLLLFKVLTQTEV